MSERPDNLADTITEDALLGSILISEDATRMLGSVSDLLPAPRSAWFTKREHRVIAWALDAAAAGLCKADFMSVMDWLSSQPREAAHDYLIGRSPPPAGYKPTDPTDTAAGYIGGFIPKESGTNNLKTLRVWAERLRRLGDAREAHVAALRMVQAIETKPLDLAGAVGATAATLHRLATGGAREQDMGSALAEVLNSEQPISASEACWGFGPMDGGDAATRFVRGEVTVLAAPSGGGKTSLALQAAAATAAKHGAESVAIASLEMPTTTLASIIAGRMVGIPPAWIRNKDSRVPANVLTALGQLAEQWTQSKSMLCRDNTVGPDARSLDAILGWLRFRAMVSGGKLQLAIIDHMHLIARPARASAIDWIEQCSGQIKACAAALNIPILVLAQMTKEGAKAMKGKDGKVTGTPEPVLQDLRGAAALGNDAAQVVFVHDEQAGMDQQDETRRVRILVRKNRYGASRGYDAMFVASQQAFVPPLMIPKPRNSQAEEERMRRADALADELFAPATPQPETTETTPCP